MKSNKESKTMAVLRLLERRPHTSLELMHAVGSSNVRTLITNLRHKGYVIVAHQLPSFGDESTIFQYELKGGGKHAQGKSTV